MKLAGVRVPKKRKYKIITQSICSTRIAPNILNQKFKVEKPNKVWASDITYIKTLAGWSYLAVVIDLYSRMVVGFSVSTRIDSLLTINALKKGICRRKPDAGLIFHSDRGSQYCSDNFQDIIEKNGMIASMSQKGNCWDNAVVESFFSTLKRENASIKTYRNCREVQYDTMDYIEMFYNSNRQHSYLGYYSPREFEFKNRSVAV
jgi:putative transposase